MGKEKVNGKDAEVLAKWFANKNAGFCKNGHFLGPDTITVWIRSNAKRGFFYDYECNQCRRNSANLLYRKTRAKRP